MGYFSNGSELSDYEARWCFSCVHNVESGCQIMLAHMIHNGETGPDKILDLLIPISADKLTNLKCRMHISTDQVARARYNAKQLRLFGDLTVTPKQEPEVPIYVAAT